jgi:hypothetical protein
MVTERCMVRTDKREQRIRQNTRNVNLADFEWLVSRYGKVEFGGSHALASIGNIRYPYRRQNPMNHHYVEELLRIIDNRTRK